MRRLAATLPLALLLSLTALAEEPSAMARKTLPGTKPLRLTGDLAARRSGSATSRRPRPTPSRSRRIASGCGAISASWTRG